MGDESKKQGKGEVVIQRVERDLAQVTRRYVVLVLVEGSEPATADAVLQAVRAGASGLRVARRSVAPSEAAQGGGNGEPVALDVREGLLLTEGDTSVQLEFYAFAECPWFDKDAPPGAWAAVYELVGDVALQNKERDARYVLLLGAARALSKLAPGGSVFDLQEWRVVPDQQ